MAMLTLLKEVPACPCEVIHPWAPESCFQGTASFFLKTLRNAAPMYFSLHFLTSLAKIDRRALFLALSNSDNQNKIEKELSKCICSSDDCCNHHKRKKSENINSSDPKYKRWLVRLTVILMKLKDVFERTAKNTVRSSAFLASLAGSIVCAICLLRSVLGKTYVCTFGMFPGLLASWSLLLETPSRRHDFAVYVVNVTLRILFRKLQLHGLKPIPQGEKFVAFISLWTLLIAQRQQWSHQGKLIQYLLQIVVSEDELKSIQSDDGMPTSNLCM